MYPPQQPSFFVRRSSPRSSRPTASVLVAAVAALGVAGCSDLSTAPTTPAAVTVPSLSMATWQGTGTAATITSRRSPSQCMDAWGFGTTNGTRVTLYTCTGASNQKFVWMPNGEIRNGSLCLDAAGNTGRNGDQVILWNCWGGPNQHWTATASGQIKGINGRCLEIPGGNTANGRSLGIWDCNGGTHQIWDEHVAPVLTAPVIATAPGSPAAVLAFMAATNVPSVASITARGGAYAKYEADFASYANTQWAADSTSFEANFYDRAMIYYVWWARTGNATYLDRATKLALVARTYIESQNFAPPTYNLMIDGVALHALVTGDQRSAMAVAKVADKMADPRGWYSYVAGHTGDGEGDSRNSARILTAVVDAYLLRAASPAGYNYGALLPDLESRILGTQASDGAYRWPNQCGYGKPFMTGMLNDALIRYYTSVQADSRIVPAVKRAVDFMWANDWVASSQGFRYLDAACNNPSSGGTGGPTPDLNNLITSGFAFVAKQTGDGSYADKADAAFAGAVNSAWLTGKKQFNQAYTSSFHYLAFRF